MDDGHGGDVHSVYLVENAFEDESQVALAEREEAAGVGMAINGAAAGKMVVAVDLVWTVPIHEVILDGFAVGVVADMAEALVAFQGRSFWRRAPFGSANSAGGLIGIELFVGFVARLLLMLSVP